MNKISSSELAPVSDQISGAARAVSTAVAIVLPAYNEQERIAATLETVWRFFAERRIAAEIIVADDGSTDNTLEIANAFAASHRNITVLALPHGGKAKAVLAGLARSNSPIAGFTDVDLAAPLDTWDRCADAFRSGFDVAIASREGSDAARIGEPAYRHVMGRVFNGMVRFLLLPGIHDTQCGFKFFTREALDEILPHCRLYTEHDVTSRPRVTAFDVELLYIARRRGLKTAVVPVTWIYGESSKVNPITDTFQNFRDVLMVRWNGWRGRY
ncbi:MAG TPA: dolichyl-phosphate beta-glucosyltransferase [Thermomicrobiales bacterium]|nr:dolichyl-phosphate beta-glucosyltransferase [Thermomicrobiales bacterium]